MSKKVLVIENDLAFLKLLQYALAKHGYDVVISSNGRDGLKKAREENPALIILEVMLPGMDGLEICYQLRAEGNSLPIVMMSEKVPEENMMAGLKLGANEYILKPVMPSVITNVVNEILLSKPGHRNSMRTEKSIGS